jgi:hypothetical protein
MTPFHPLAQIFPLLDGEALVDLIEALMSWSGAAAKTNARDTAIIVSLLLQHGCSPETIRRAPTRDRAGSAAGPLGTLLDILNEAADGERPEW